MKKFSHTHSLITLLLVISAISIHSQGIYKWNLSTGGAWNVSGNWTLQSGTANGNGYPGSADSAWITVNITATITAVPSAIQSVLLDGTGVVTLTSSGTTTVGGYVTVKAGQLINGGTTASLVFGSGAHYDHAVDGGTIPTATWATGSYCDITGIKNGNSGIVFTSGPYNTYEGPFGFNQTFYNVTWNCPNMASSISIQNSYPVDVQGAFIIYNTGLQAHTTALDFSTTGANTMWTGGLTLHGGQLDLTKSTNTSTFTFSIGGDLTIDRMELDSSLPSATEPQIYLTQGLNFSSTTTTIFKVGGNVSIHWSTPSTDYTYSINFPYYYLNDATMMVAGNWSQVNSPVFGGTTNNGVTGCKFIFDGTGVHTFSADQFFGTQLNPIDVSINSGETLDVGTSVINNYGAFTLNSGASLMIGSKYGITSSGTGATSGNIQNTNSSAARSFNTGASYTYYNAYGTGRQITGTGLPATVANLTIGAPASPFNSDSVTNVNLLSAAHVSNVFTLDSGLLYLGSNNLTLSSGIPASVAGSPSSGNMVVADAPGHGLFIRTIATGTNSYLFPVGDSSLNYTPVTLNFATNTAAGNIGMRVTNAIEPNNNTPSAPAEYLSRYWTFSNAGLTNYSYTGNFIYPTANIVGTESLIKLSQWTGSAWFEDDTGSAAASNILTLFDPLNQTTAPLTGDFTGRTQLAPAGCTAPGLTAMANGEATAAQVCTGGSVALTANPIGGSGCSGNFEYAWSNGTGYWDGTDFTSINPLFNTGYSNITVTTSSNGSFDVTGRCSADSTCTSGSSVTVSVIALVTPSITISAPQDTICSGTRLTFSAGITNGGDGPVYQWMKNGTGTGTNSNTYSDNNLANNDIINCILTSNAQCAAPATDTSNSIWVNVITTVTPGISISAPQTTICSGTPQTLTASVTNPGISPVYQWQRNGSDVATGSDSYTDSFTNNDHVICILTSKATCASPVKDTSNALVFTVNTTVIPSVIISAPQDTICAGTPLTFSANGINKGALPIYQWQKNGVIVGNNVGSYTDSTLANGDNIMCVLTSNAVCADPDSAISNDIVVNVNAIIVPFISIKANTGDTICSGTSVTFSASASGQGNLPAYQWQLNNNPVGGDSNSYTSSSIMNGDSINCILNSNAACANPVTTTAPAITMNVVSNLIPTVTVHSNTVGTCTGATAGFTLNTSNTGAAPVYQWKVNDINVGTDSSAFSSSMLQDGDIVYCQLISNASCANPATVISAGDTVTIFSLPIDTIAPVGPDTICSNDSIALSAPAGYSYRWNEGDSTQTYYAKQAGNYYVTVTDHNGCTAASNRVAVSVYPVSSVSVIVNGDTLSSFGGITYQWFKDGQAIAGANADFYVAVDAGYYSVEISDIHGCKAISSSVYVNAMGIVNQEEPSITLYPNPNSAGVWQLDAGNELVGSKLEIYDAEGRVVLQSMISKQKSEISLSVESGIYLLRISTGTSTIIRKLIRL